MIGRAEGEGLLYTGLAFMAVGSALVMPCLSALISRYRRAEGLPEPVLEEEELARAKMGPDFPCAFCGTRNPAGAESCSQPLQQNPPGSCG